VKRPPADYSPTEKPAVLPLRITARVLTMMFKVTKQTIRFWIFRNSSYLMQYGD